MTGWSFYALGTPAPQGSKKHVGRGIMVESSKALAPWRDTVTSAAFGAGPLLDGPVAVRMVFTVPRPKTAPKAAHQPKTAPDLSKLARACEDSITAAGLWADDARVADYRRLAKVWAGHDEEGDDLPVPGVIVAAISITSSVHWRTELAALFAAARLLAWDRHKIGVPA